MCKNIFFPVALALLLFSYQSTGQQVNRSTGKEVSVAIAANMQFTMVQLKNEFEKETGIKVDVTIGSSGKLCAQIMEDAPFDVFVSADTKYPAELYRKGFAANHPEVYAYGCLVLWTMRSGLKPDIKVLTSAQVNKIAIANPESAPYGVAAEDVLKHCKIYDAVRDKLVYGENIAQTQQFIASGAAEIGFIAKSLVLADEMKNKGFWTEIDHNVYTPIAQGAEVLKHGQETNKDAAQRFYRFLYSKQAKAIFRKYGYLVN